jgi:hypothetical protein
MPDGGGDIQVHTDDMLIRPKQMYKYVTKVLQEQKGLKLTCSATVEAHVGVKIVYGTDEEGQHTVTLRSMRVLALQDCATSMLRSL